MHEPTVIPLVELASRHLDELPEEQRADVLDSISAVLTRFGEAPQMADLANQAAAALREAKSCQLEFMLILNGGKS